MAPAPPEVFLSVLTLLGREHFRRVAQRLSEALAGCVGEGHLLGAERLDGNPVDAGLRQQPLRTVTRSPRLLTHRQEVLDRSFGDGAQLVLLLGRRVQFDGRMPHYAIDAIFDLGRTQGAAHEPRATVHVAPARGAVLTDGPRGHGTGERRDKGHGRDEQPPPTSTRSYPLGAADGSRVRLFGQCWHSSSLRSVWCCTGSQPGRPAFPSHLLHVKICKASLDGYCTSHDRHGSCVVAEGKRCHICTIKQCLALRTALRLAWGALPVG